MSSEHPDLVAPTSVHVHHTAEYQNIGAPRLAAMHGGASYMHIQRMTEILLYRHIHEYTRLHRHTHTVGGQFFVCRTKHTHPGF